MSPLNKSPERRYTSTGGPQKESARPPQADHNSIRGMKTVRSVRQHQLPALYGSDRGTPKLVYSRIVERESERVRSIRVEE